MQSFAFVFPGQGSQAVGMLTDMAREFPEIERTFTEASSVLGYDLWKLTSEGPADVLDQTVYTQPAVLTASIAIWRVLQAKKQHRPDFLAGHSLGEYSALVCADAISFQDAVRLVAARGQFMQDAVPVGQGGLAAIIGLDDDAVKALCESVKEPHEVLSPVNFNCPGQVVIAGHVTAVERAIVQAKAAGARLAKLLPVSAPSHCELMKPAADKLKEMLATLTINTPTIAVINNVDVAVYQDADSIRDGLVRQLYMPVRWVEIVHKLSNSGVKSVVECGPGKVLSGLNKRIVADLDLKNTADLVNLQGVIETL